METKELTEKRTLSRRELLKVLAASGGALAAGAFLPARWVRPFVQGGVLPAHAQLTGCANLEYIGESSCNPQTCPPGYYNYLLVTYDPPGLVPESALYKACDRAWPLAVFPVLPGTVRLLITPQQWDEIEHMSPAICDPFEAYIQIRFSPGCYARYYLTPTRG